MLLAARVQLTPREPQYQSQTIEVLRTADFRLTLAAGRPDYYIWVAPPESPTSLLRLCFTRANRRGDDTTRFTP